MEIFVPDRDFGSCEVPETTVAGLSIIYLNLTERAPRSGLDDGELDVKLDFSGAVFFELGFQLTSGPSFSHDGVPDDWAKTDQRGGAYHRVQSEP